MDPTFRGWSWTPFTFGWIEPTSRALLALQVLRPSATAEIEDAVKLLADRSCVGGGWNYGNREVWEKELEPYAQTTAIALIGLQGAGDPKVVADGYAVLRRLWPVENGGMSLGVALLALRLAPDGTDAERAEIEAELVVELRRDGVPRRQRRAGLGDARHRRPPRRDHGGALMAISRRTFLVRGAEIGLGVAAVGLVGARLLDRDDDNPSFYDEDAFPAPGNPRVAVVKATSLRHRPRGDGARRAAGGRGRRRRQDRAAEAEPRRVRRRHGDQHRSAAREGNRRGDARPRRDVGRRSAKGPATAATPSTSCARRACSTRSVTSTRRSPISTRQA